MTNAQRFGTVRAALPDNYDTDLLQSVITTYARYTGSDEDRLMGREFAVLIRLIRANPREMLPWFELLERFRGPSGNINYAMVDYTPNEDIGTRLVLSPRNPLFRMLKMHYPPEHRIWNYVTKRT